MLQWRWPVAMLVVGVLMAELASSQGVQLRTTLATATQILPLPAPKLGTGHAWIATPPVVQSKRIAPLFHAEPFEAEPEFEAEPTPRPRRRVGATNAAVAAARPVEDADAVVTIRGLPSVAPEEIVPITEPTFVPARALASPRPRHVPSPFPVPRGSRTSLELVIDERGRVSSARVASSGAGFYDAPLLSATRDWRFEPARQNGRPTKSIQTLQVALP